MNPIFIQLGRQTLAGLDNIALTLTGKNVEPTSLENDQLLGLIKYGAFLEDNDLKEHGVGRVVRKTSERQSRWVIDAAISTWKNYTANYLDGSHLDTNTVGLFLGLGTIDCEDNDAPITFDGTLKDYAERLMADTKPLSALTLLNSTAASHIAQLTNITGANSVFSPFADAGAQAIIEAYFSIQEQHCEHALVAAGSQKITPWYCLCYRDFIQQWNWPNAFPTESAAALIATHRKEGADGCLHVVKRAFSYSTSLPLMDELLTELAGNQIPIPKQVIYTGGFLLNKSQEQLLQRYLPETKLCYLDQIIGNTGPAGALHAMHLAVEMLKQGQGLSTLPSSTETQKLDSSTVLIIAEGFNGQICYMVAGGIHD